MNIVMWILAGGAMGWAGLWFWGFNEERGLKVSVIIGGVGGFLGGELAGMLGGAPAAAGGFSLFALVLAAAVAAALLVAGNMVHARWGV